MTQNEKTVVESDILDWLRNLGTGFPPVTIELIETEAKLTNAYRQAEIDALVQVNWLDQSYRFATEIKSLSTPKAIETAINRAKDYAKTLELYPLVVTPYLSEEQLQRMEREQVSGLDLSGNGVLQVPGKLLVWRSGAPNQYPRGQLIQNVYRGNSSVVARAFLIKPEYKSVQELLTEIILRNGVTTLPTVSKACSKLSDDLIIDRSRKERTTGLRLLQPKKLLDKLASNFRPSQYRRQLIGKCSMNPTELTQALRQWSIDDNQQIVRTGTDSTRRYATMAREQISRFYCTNLPSLARCLKDSLSESSPFPNVEFFETSDSTVYFDVREELNASPIQCYLELQAGDKREQETAEQVRTRLLENIGAGNELF